MDGHANKGIFLSEEESLFRCFPFPKEKSLSCDLSPPPLPHDTHQLFPCPNIVHGMGPPPSLELLWSMSPTRASPLPISLYSFFFFFKIRWQEHIICTTPTHIEERNISTYAVKVPIRIRNLGRRMKAECLTTQLSLYSPLYSFIPLFLVH